MTTIESPARRTRNTWISILIAAVIVLCLAGLTLVAGGIYFVRHNLHTSTMSAEAATAEFDRLTARFAGQQPLLALQGNDVIVQPPSGGERHEITALHVVAYDSNDGKLVNVTVPGWLLRMAPSGDGHIRINGVDVLERGGRRITLDDLERHGPGLVMAAPPDDNRGRVLIWSE
jgi:hypothetical protein